MKKLEILVIEDDAKHATDARQYFDSQIAKEADIAVTYAKNYVEAKNIIANKGIDGVISDIFFPYENKAVKGKVKGWNDEAAKKLKSILSQYQNWYRCSWDAEQWIKGKTMHPTGLLVYEELKEKGVPTILNTDTYHHGRLTQPVYGHVQDTVKVRDYIARVVDSGFSEQEKGNRKDWQTAYTNLITLIVVPQLGINPDCFGRTKKEKAKFAEACKHYVKK